MSQSPVGTMIEGYEVPVINENAVRVGAGILFTLGAISFSFAIADWSTDHFRPFGMLFMFDMMIRLFAGDRWSPTLAIGQIVTSRLEPNWVGAPQKEFAWGLGLAMALLSCASMGLLSAPALVTFVLCGLCVTFLFLEAAFGYCVGCELQSRFSKDKPMYCANGTCEVPAEPRRWRRLDS